MEKMKFETPDMVQMNVEKIAALFPNCVTESKAKDGKLKKAVNFDALKQMLGESVAEGDESYEFTWVGKRDAMVEAAKPIRKTLRPCVEESKNFDTTENLYIEGDNLEALKLLQEGYLGKVKMIYIDPPYNTGNDFIYKDDFRMDSAKYAEESGAVDDEGNRMVQNSDSNGRFHSDWCSMIYSRLLLARNLLTDDGVIFISIDDNEQANLKKICDEVFGGSNFVANVIWKHTQQSKNDELHFSRQYNHTFVYAHDMNQLPRFYMERTAEDNVNYSNPDNDPKGLWRSGDVRSPNYRKTLCYDIVAPNGNVIKAPEKGWRWSEESIKEKISTGEIKFKSDFSGIIRKIYLNDQVGRTPENLWDGPKYGTTRQSAAMIKELFNGIQVFDTPKPIELVQNMLALLRDPSGIVLDFFSGSATTAHAVMQLNAEDGGHRKFIMVQLPEKCDENSEAAKAGYKTICEIGKERIRRAGDKILAEQQAKEKSAADKTDLFDSASDKPTTAKPLDIGFRVLKIDDSNMKDVYYSAGEISQQDLVEQISNIKDGRTDMDLLFGCLVDWGVPLSLPIKTETIENLQVYNVNDGDLVACFASDIPEAAIRQIAATKPLRAVFRDSSFKSDSAKINVTEIFKTLSPNTTVKVV
ncbi:putative type III restriction-modification system, Mod subunit [Fibrobacter succinogenes subsp. succinogenes S85]|uniref:site-specific DNA-methyltransferase (adenine-specific) n=1 Tax=Fibrobacter succinogenes (strain ATCC 19169 / S85) TaxID=59374 RepID=C9RQR2_FIBSS|nr:site-specific DNA-methyltransferase [Fibrobacter succinogenes]ACX74898.1 Site-specific DNA-methyltransferase (adenine-specific) [Fibrobacter succinogenes subsp. succinogenes S85]ADL26067.1 putative type III restriction-modification system, Mod subunit [Fibrobacter succinogenes subsp. succinogenes S85]